MNETRVQVKQVAAELLAAHPTLDILVNNAGEFSFLHPLRLPSRLDYH